MTNQVGSKAWTQNRLASRLGLRFPIIQGPLGGLSSQRLTAAVSNISHTLGGSFATTATSTCKSPRCERGFPAIATLRWWRECCVWAVTAHANAEQQREQSRANH
jgi:NAD(P)H-dependent flavin oxidoreductase YrpB (nitropropane dioxygenase family)